MKLPKTRDTIYLVVRYCQDETEPIAAFRTLDRADEYAGSCQQEFVDRGVEGFVFDTQAVIYYNE
jgi:hypothetical protein